MHTRGKPSQRQQLLSKETLRTLLFGADAMCRCLVHPYIVEKFKKCAKPVFIAAGIVYLASLGLVLPILFFSRLVELLSFGKIELQALTGTWASWVKGTITLVPYLALLLLRRFIRKPLSKCFIHVLQELNPATAKAINESKMVRERTSGHRQSLDKIIMLLSFEVVLHVARRSPYLGRAAVVVTHFLTMKQVLGRDRAVGLSLLGLIPHIEPWVLQSVQLWRASNLLGQELLAEYIQKCVAPRQRASFLKLHDVDIPIFALPGALLLQIPLAGPLFFIPLQASAAYLVDRLDRQEGWSCCQRTELPGGGKLTFPTERQMGSPTLPSAPHPTGIGL